MNPVYRLSQDQIMQILAQYVVMANNLGSSRTSVTLQVRPVDGGANVEITAEIEAKEIDDAA